MLSFVPEFYNLELEAPVIKFKTYEYANKNTIHFWAARQFGIFASSGILRGVKLVDSYQLIRDTSENAERSLPQAAETWNLEERNLFT